MQKEVINLGKLFVKELGLELGSDTLSRWMAHYLAERMTCAESLEGAEKDAAEKECFDVILKLWHHRWNLPYGQRPLEDFKPLLDLLQQLNVERTEPYFFPMIPSRVSRKSKKQDANKNPVDIWIEVAKEVNSVARQLIHDAFRQAAQAAKGAKTKEWLENAVALPNSHDIQIIRAVLDMEPDDSYEDGTVEKIESSYEVERIKNRLERLAKFSRLNEAFVELYKSQLADIEKTP